MGSIDYTAVHKLRIISLFILLVCETFFPFFLFLHDINIFCTRQIKSQEKFKRMCRPTSIRWGDQTLDVLLPHRWYSNFFFILIVHRLNRRCLNMSNKNKSIRYVGMMLWFLVRRQPSHWLRILEISCFAFRYSSVQLILTNCLNSLSWAKTLTGFYSRQYKLAGNWYNTTSNFIEMTNGH